MTDATMRKISTGRTGPQVYQCECGWEGSNANSAARQHAKSHERTAMTDCSIRPGYPSQVSYESGTAPAAQPDPPPRPAEFVHRRMPDATRACALGNAVELFRSLIEVEGVTPSEAVAEVEAAARAFERFLDPSSDQP